MSGINMLLDMGKRALLANQLALEVTSNNIANVDTAGYSRQTVELLTNPPVNSAFGNLGTGVKVGSIQRYFDAVLARTLNDKTADLQAYQAQKSALQQVASIFNETQDGGLSDALSEFWSAWGDLADDPTGSAQRQVVLEKAQTLADAFNTRADSLTQQRSSLSGTIRLEVNSINELTSKIAELNAEIVQAEAGGKTANTLRDSRDAALTNLASLVGINYYETSDGTVNVMLNGGGTLVQSNSTWDMNYADGTQQVSNVTTVADVGGSLGGTWFSLNSPSKDFYVWYNVDGGSTNPAVAGKTGIEVDISAGDTAASVAAKTAAALNDVSYFTATATGANLTITNTYTGATADAANGTASPGFTITTPTPGVGSITLTGADGSSQDVTSTLSGGQLGGYLEVRNNLIPDYLDQLNTLSREFMDQINSQHMQGIGENLYSSLTGSNAVTDPAVTPLNADPGLRQVSDIQNGVLTFQIDDASTHVATVAVNITASMTLNQVVTAINTALSPTYLTASVSNNQLQLQGIDDYTFGFSSDTSNIASVLGLNPFFASNDKNFASTMSVNQDLIDDPTRIATGVVDSAGNHAVGDNSNALDITDLETTAISGLGNVTFADAYESLVSNIGTDTDSADLQGTYMISVVQQYAMMQSSVSGVSLDEELAALIKYQRSYQAAAKMITVADELYQTLLSLIT